MASLLRRCLHKESLIIAVCIGLAAFLRLWNLTQTDFVTDEALNSFRAIGMVDFLSTEFQTTPLEWLEEPQWWLRLSFHDHPPLSFLIQFIFFKIFGVSDFVARLPFALAGIGSVYLLYALTQRLSNVQTALVAALLLGVNNLHIAISRIGLQESIVIFFVLLALWSMVRAHEEKKHWYWFGLIFGLGLLTKYTVIYLLPVVFAYSAIVARPVFRLKEFWFSWIIAVLLFSPVIIYNIALYQNFSHFDLQFSYLLHQPTPNWQVLPGKSDEGIVGNIVGSVKTLATAISPAMLTVFVLWIFYALVIGVKKGIREKEKMVTKENHLLNVSLLIALQSISLLILFCVIGPGVRFIAMLTPWMALSVASMATLLIQRRWAMSYAAGRGIVLIFICFEIMYSYNSNIAVIPKGRAYVAYTKVVRENASYGFSALENYLANKFDHRTTTLLLQAKRPLIADIIKKNFNKRRRKRRFSLMQALVIYDANINWYPRVWHLNRRALYHGLPLISADDALQVTRDQGEDFYQLAGFNEFIFIKAEKTLIGDALPTDAAAILAAELEENGVRPRELKNPQGEVAFKVYEY